jgi:hypothetical protein
MIMDLDTIGIGPAEARAKLAEYQAALDAGGATAEDQAIAAGYRAVARGRPLISLARTVARGGWHPNGLPRIGVCQAEATQCRVQWSGGDLVFTDEWSHGNRGALVGHHSVRVPVAGDDRPGGGNRWWAGSAPVPLVPPGSRPRRPAKLSRCHVLWEVEEWKQVAPVDPALIRHVRGDLWEVLATWDLTQLERLVLMQR